MQPSDLDDIAIDWSDIAAASEATNELTEELANDRTTLRALFERCIDEPRLLSRCEHHRLQDKVVLLDALDRGFEVRLHFHVPTPDHPERLHDHRFSFSTRILCGAYRHEAHRLAAGSDKALERAEEVGPAERIDLPLQPLVSTVEGPSAFYTLHHSVLHTTLNQPDTVSLFIRGPAEKDRRLITDRATGQIWWGRGSAAETPEERAQRAMSRDELVGLRDRAQLLGIL